MAAKLSELKQYVGISATTITDGVTMLIEAFVPDFLPNEKGTPTMRKFAISTEDVFTHAKPVTNLTRSDVIACAYLGGSNCSVPCIHKGERVWVLNLSGTEQYYWLPIGRDAGLRLRECHRIFVMDQPNSVKNGSYNDVTDDNSYFIEMDTNTGRKIIHIHTTRNDGEIDSYDIKIRPEDGILEIYDDLGNHIRLTSQEHIWHIENVDKSFVDINKENITIQCNDTITLNAGKNIIQKAGTLHKTNAPTITRDGNTITDNGSTVNITGGSGDCVIDKTSLNHHVHPYGVHSGITAPPVP